MGLHLARDALIPYLAGLIDGEGFIGVGQFHEGLYHHPVIAVAMTDARPIDLLAQSFGGESRFQEPRSERHKPLYEWKLTGTPALEAIKTLSPFLLVKRDQAESILKSDWQKFHKSNPIPDSERALRQIIYAEVKIMNKRGAL